MLNYGQKMENIWVRSIGMLIRLPICYSQKTNETSVSCDTKTEEF